MQQPQPLSAALAAVEPLSASYQSPSLTVAAKEGAVEWRAVALPYARCQRPAHTPRFGVEGSEILQGFRL